MSAPFFRGFLTGPATSACLRRATRRRQAPDEARPGLQARGLAQGSPAQGKASKNHPSNFGGFAICGPCRRPYTGGAP